MSEITSPERQKIHVVGGGTIEPVREHLALSARAYGGAAMQIAELSQEYWPDADVQLHLTRMADPKSDLETSEDLRGLAEDIVRDPDSSVVFWSPAVVDFKGKVGSVESGLHAQRLKSIGEQTMRLTPAEKIVPIFRHDSLDGQPPRKDLFAVGFKTTTGATPREQFTAGLKLVKQNSLNLVLANDTIDRRNMVVTPEEAAYHETGDRYLALRGLVEMAHLRAGLEFSRTRVVGSERDLVPWNSEQISDTLRTVVEHCIKRGAYKPFLGVTTGHFGQKMDNGEFISSRRKTDHNDIAQNGLVRTRLENDGKEVVAYGAKPSAGARSQRQLFEDHPEMDCVVHFHCPDWEDSEVPSAEQRQFECGSTQCGLNTSGGMVEFEGGDIKAVFLEDHGPNILFNSSIDPKRVIDFIEKNFNLHGKSGGYVPIPDKLKNPGHCFDGMMYESEYGYPM